MLHSIIKRFDSAGLVDEAQAHCDIPCGIYDPMPALIAAVSVVRLMDIAHQTAADKAEPVPLHNLLSRCAMRKEEEAEKVKHEVRIIWGDYFKGPLLEKHPEVHALVHSIMMKGSACKQDVHREDAVELVELVNKFAELFWKTKGKETKRVTAPYPPNLPIVYPILD
ncbi:MAG: superoxide dismutase, Ni [Pseudomonadota bacterium]